uniref:Uncharacterized protein n=1 Tax=Arundo donax TaxID=35708 RepID=A0A0A8Y4Y2_ARUDO
MHGCAQLDRTPICKRVSRLCGCQLPTNDHRDECCATTIFRLCRSYCMQCRFTSPVLCR